MSGAVIVRRQNRLMRRFREEGALRPVAARTLEELGVRNGFVFRRMASQRVFIEAGGDRYYMDEEAAHAFVRRRTTIITWFLLAGALLIILLIALR